MGPVDEIRRTELLNDRDSPDYTELPPVPDDIFRRLCEEMVVAVNGSHAQVMATAALMNAALKSVPRKN